MNKEDKEILTQCNPWKINGKRVICLYDIHQQIDWVKAVLFFEKGNYDHVVFGGDWFDSFHEPPRVASVKETAQFIVDIIEKNIYGEHTLLLGNHDLAYLEAWKATSNFRNPKFMFNACSGYSNNKASNINRVFKWQEHWKKFKLFALANGWLLTHAGLRANNFRPFMEPEKSLEVLEEEFNAAINHVNAFPHHLFDCGRDCGGRAAFGGPLWCRPNEFEDELPYPQIFGHTFAGYNKAMQLGRCFGIDAARTTYAIIHSDGRLELKALQWNNGNYEPRQVTVEKQPTRSELESACNRAIAELEKVEGKIIINN